jgi:glyoxylase-like metal-dependent hydrolase (beta-lactamase superfamily II)
VRYDVPDFVEGSMRRLFVLGVLAAAGSLSIAAAAFQQPAGQAAPKVVEVDKLKDNLYVMKGGGGNSAVFIAADGVTVVDAKLPGWGTPLLEKIKSVTDKPVVRIINTHTHFDHVSGNVEFPATVDVVTHENTKTYMEQANPVYGLQTGQQTNIFKENGGRGMSKRTFKDKMTLGRGADQIDLYYFGRAHTGGDAYVVFPALRVMHVGDTFPTKDMPIMDKNNGGSAVAFSATLAKAAAVGGVDTIINGHNPATTTPADLKLYSEFIADFVKFAQDGKKSGKTVDEVAGSWKVPAKYTGYANPNPARVKADVQVTFDESK